MATIDLRWARMTISGARQNGGEPCHPRAEVFGPLAVHRGICDDWTEAWTITDMPTGAVVAYARYKADARAFVEALAGWYPPDPSDPDYPQAVGRYVHQTLRDRAVVWRDVRGAIFLPGKDGY